MTATAINAVDEGLAVSGSMTTDNAATLLAQGTAAVGRGKTRFDLSEVKEIDSSSLAVLFGWQRAAQAQGKGITLVNPPQTLRSLADVYGVAELLPLS